MVKTNGHLPMILNLIMENGIIIIYYVYPSHTIVIFCSKNAQENYTILKIIEAIKRVSKSSQLMISYDYDQMVVLNQGRTKVYVCFCNSDIKSIES